MYTQIFKYLIHRDIISKRGTLLYLRSSYIFIYFYRVVVVIRPSESPHSDSLLNLYIMRYTHAHARSRFTSDAWR